MSDKCLVRPSSIRRQNYHSVPPARNRTQQLYFLRCLVRVINLSQRLYWAVAKCRCICREQGVLWLTDEEFSKLAVRKLLYLCRLEKHQAWLTVVRLTTKEVGSGWLAVLAESIKLNARSTGWTIFDGRPEKGNATFNVERQYWSVFKTAGDARFGDTDLARLRPILGALTMKKLEANSQKASGVTGALHLWCLVYRRARFAAIASRYLGEAFLVNTEHKWVWLWKTSDFDSDAGDNQPSMCRWTQT